MTDQETRAAQTKFSRARANLILNHPFYATIALKLDCHPSEAVDTMATNGATIAYNPEFTNGLTDPECAGVVAHEVLHVAFKHHLRRGDRDPRGWNIAADYAINGILLDAGFTLPEGGLHNPAYAGMSAESIYDLLPESDRNGGSQGQGWGDVEDSPGTESGDADAIAQEAADADQSVIQAAMASKMQGKGVGGLDGLIADVTSSRVRWQDVLRRFVDSSGVKDYSLARPNRRMFPHGVYLPGLVPDGLGHLFVVVDTSGSISAPEYAAFMGELETCIEDVKPETIRLIHCDSDVQFDRTFTSDEALPRKVHGGGGTDMSPAFALAKEAQPRAVVCFTDMFMDEPPDPGRPVLWVSWSGEGAGLVPTYGELIHVTPE